MSYENPQVPHEVNVSRENVLAEFVRLAIGLSLLVLAAAAVLYYCGGALARLVPYPVEQRWVGDRVLAPVVEPADAAGAPRVGTYLQELADDLARHMELPAGMRPVVHWSDTDVPLAEPVQATTSMRRPRPAGTGPAGRPGTAAVRSGRARRTSR